MGSGGDLEGLTEEILRIGLFDGVQKEYPLGLMTTYRVGGPAALFVRPCNEEELLRLAQVTAGSKVPILLLGRGSNMLVSDEGFEGLVIQLGSGFEGIRIRDGVVVSGGAVDMPIVARRSVAEDLAGFEWAVGVPGSVGGAVRMNAGGHGSDMAAVLRSTLSVDLHSGERSCRTVRELKLGYRSSAIRASEVVMEVELALELGKSEDGERLLADIVRWRRKHQPGGQNSGSVFANPLDDSAGRLIELVGARGLQIGTARVSEKHANFIQAARGGSAGDVFKVMSEVRCRVATDLGVDLRVETVLVGFGADAE